MPECALVEWGTMLIQVTTLCGIAVFLLLTCILTAQAQEVGNMHGAMPDGIDCAACHRTDAWLPLRDSLIFDHSRQTRFPLTGSHVLTTCTTCHIDLNFSEPDVAPNDCGSCHLDVHQGAFAQVCVDCHNTTSFQDVEGLEIHNQTRFPLTGAHMQLSCASCHSSDEGGAFSLLDADCLSCHEPDYDDAHSDLGFPTTCQNCHTTLAWAATPPFDHAAASGGFQLLGAHQPLDCASCHTAPGFQPVFPAESQQDCIACHQTDFEREHGGTGFPTDCQECHTVDTFGDAVFEHAVFAGGFALIGAHETLSCAACHTPSPDFGTLFDPAHQDDCFACHQTDYQAQHAEDGFPTTCQTCHSTQSWDGAVVDHLALSSGFALIGAHNNLECSACHGPPPGLDPLFDPANDTDCFACHAMDYQDEHGSSGFPTYCIDCHTTQSWADAEVDHVALSDGFALIGAHDGLNCSACHGLPPAFDPLFNPADEDDCFTCHAAGYQQEHAGSGFPTTCQTCHTTEQWAGATVDHLALSAGFALVGAHNNLDCSACHGPPPGLDPLFSPSSQEDCQTCHQPDYDAAHAGSGFPTDCQTCHAVTDWTDARFEHAAQANGFGLVGAHDDLPCLACHAPPPGFDLLFMPTGQDDCFTCHMADYQDEHAGSGFPTNCLECHTTENWNDAEVNHAVLSGGFSLLGAHNALDCSACHGPPPGLDPLFNPANDSDCFACHATDYHDEHAGSDFPTTCLTCHNTDDWSGAEVDHIVLSDGFALVGAHDVLDCSACHGPPPALEPLFDPSNQDDCIACHVSEFEQQHAGSGFPTQCLECHSTEEWTGAEISHVVLSNGFALIGAHDGLECSGCHGPPPDLNPLFNPSGQDDCIACHETDYERQHAADGYPMNCLMCHTALQWTGGMVDHLALSDGFALVGAHDELDCASCHGPPPDLVPLFNPSGDEDCFTCHAADYEQQHTADGFPTTCLTCHNTEEWGGAEVNHAVLSDGFALIGAHAALSCAMCHGPPPDLIPLFNPLDESDCLTCHQSDYDQHHAGSSFPTNCLECHSTDTWTGAQINHTILSDGFALVGAHDALDCSACHGPPPDLDPLFNPADQGDCFACHQSEYNQRHTGDGFPTTCQDCHTADTWVGAAFDHAATANFALIGAHDGLNCSACHGPPPDLVPLFNPSDENDCFTCHTSDYQQQHGADGYPTTCQACHTTEQWTGTTVDHLALSAGFALVGAHDALACSACHSPPPDFDPLFNPADQDDCFTCHVTNYEQQHAADGYPTNCLECHSVDTWEGAQVDHVALSSGFPLIGVHDALTCSACHGPPPDLDPLFSPADENDCFTCHQPDYEQVHGGQGYPTTCIDCHTPDIWTNVDFNHDAAYFPIFTDKHEGEWASCQTCHTDPNDFNVFTCLVCHAHNQAEMDERHDEVSGYLYDSVSCYACHPDGEK